MGNAGNHVAAEHALAAIAAARPGPVMEGCVGGGTGMITARFKGGIGTASRLVRVSVDTFSVGVLVQSNYGGREELRVAGVPVGLEMAEELLPTPGEASKREGSIIIVVATDAPLLPHQVRPLVVFIALSNAGLKRNDCSTVGTCLQAGSDGSCAQWLNGRK